MLARLKQKPFCALMLAIKYVLATYSTVTYAETVAHLKTTFTQETKKLDALMFIGSKPGADEKLSDYADRLKVLYKYAGLEAAKTDYRCS